MKQRIDKNYVSPLDEFLVRFDVEHAQKSKSQQKEIAKYARIDRLRDDPQAEDIKVTLWEDF